MGIVRGKSHIYVNIGLFVIVSGEAIHFTSLPTVFVCLMCGLGCSRSEVDSAAATGYKASGLQWSVSYMVSVAAGQKLAISQVMRPLRSSLSSLSPTTPDFKCAIKLVRT